MTSEQDTDTPKAPEPSNEEMLAMAQQFVFTDPSTNKQIRIERRSHSSGHEWIAINEDKFLLNKDDGVWVWKPIFDGRDEDFLFHTSFMTARLAIVAVRKALTDQADREAVSPTT